MGNHKSSFSIDYSENKKVTISLENQIGTNQNPTGANPEVQVPQVPQPQCVVCMSAFSSPIKVLSCGHSFCFWCVFGIWHNADDRAFLECPLCRHNTQVPNRNPTRLPNNFAMMEVLGMQAVDTTIPDWDQNISEAESYTFPAAVATVRSMESDGFSSSLQYPPSLMTVFSVSVQNSQIEHMQNPLEDYEEEAVPLEDYM